MDKNSVVPTIELSEENIAKAYEVLGLDTPELKKSIKSPELNKSMKEDEKEEGKEEASEEKAAPEKKTLNE